MKKINKNYLLIILLVIAFIFRTFRLSTPPRYIFDEVYHVVTAKAYSNNNPDAYNPFAKSPEPDTAYDWLHPPLAKLIQAGSIKLLGDNSFAWRFPSAVFGTLSIFALYFLSLTITKNQNISLLAATLFSLDGLQLTMSRITMNDIFVTTFIIFTLNFFYKTLTDRVRPCHPKNLFFTGLFLGLALATKWSSLLLYPIFSIFLLPKLLKKPTYIFKYFVFLLLLPLTIYLLSYSQYFLLGYSLKDFFNLHQQIYWYQTGLSATHVYQSVAWQWPLLIRPVWFHVQYFSNKIANIYNLGNPIIFWGGLGALGFGTFKKGDSFYILTSYLLLFLPFIFSPRILFLHHYLPALPFLCLILAKTIYKNKLLTISFLFIVFLSFLFFYPLNTATPIPSNFLKFWFWLPTWK
ncbi:MAG: phospholipid carrier-dependent glycosyltransferase [Candidatus Beckwithbacteria bacterium]